MADDEGSGKNVLIVDSQNACFYIALLKKRSKHHIDSSNSPDDPIEAYLESGHVDLLVVDPMAYADKSYLSGMLERVRGERDLKVLFHSSIDAVGLDLVERKLSEDYSFQRDLHYDALVNKFYDESSPDIKEVIDELLQ